MALKSNLSLVLWRETGPVAKVPLGSGYTLVSAEGFGFDFTGKYVFT